MCTLGNGTFGDGYSHSPYSFALMPARPIAAATISFGLVSVPVNLYSSSESKASVSFNMLHKKCGSRLKQQYVCSKDGDIVPRDETVKGYEFAKDQYVILSPEELKALQDTGRAALGQYAARGQQYLVLLRPLNGVLVMEQLHYADEVRPTTEVTVPEGDVKPAELALAKQLIDQTSTDVFEPTKYKDTVRERVLETIERKVAGQEITAEAAPETGGKIIDLMEALKASLAAAPAEASEKPSKKGRKAS